MIPASVKWRTGWRRGVRYGLAGACLLGVALGLAVAWRRDTAADRWMVQMRTRGEKFTYAEFGLQRPARLDPSMEALELASSRLKAIEQSAVLLPFQELDDPVQGRRLVSWKQPNLYGVNRQVLDWERVGTLADQLQPALVELHAVLRHPASDPGWDYSEFPRRLPKFVIHRVTAQSLHQLIMVELRRNDLPAAHRDLLTLIRLSRLNEEGWTLVNQMIRVALLGVATDAVWNALQAGGWTEDQLREIQQELEGTVIIPQLPRTWEVERVMHQTEIDQYLHEGPSSLAWRWQVLGYKRPPVWLEHASFLVWRAFLSGKDRLRHLQYEQQVIDRHRRLASGVRLLDLGPLPDVTPGWWSRFQTAQDLFPVSSTPNFVRATEAATSNDAERLLAITALALERYRLRHGRYPEDLANLLPDFLDAVPKEAISGQALQYRLEADRVPMLNALGFDAPREPKDVRFVPGGRQIAPSRGRPPLVWPRPLMPDEPARSAAADEPVAEVLQLVVFEDAPLREVINTLARQAGMNIIFDPALWDTLKMPVTVRLENVTARSVFEILLRNHGLRAQENPATRIYRITPQ